MARSGFVLTVDDRTPPLVVHEGDGFRLERLPLGTQVVYPAESLTPVALALPHSTTARTSRDPPN